MKGAFQMIDNHYSTQQSIDARDQFNSFVSKVFSWMFIGLLLTTGTSYLVSQSQSILLYLYNNSFVFFGLIIAELIMVIYFTRRILKMSYSQSRILFVSYSIINGIVLSFIFILYTSTSIASTFGVTCVSFGIMALYGHFTKTDLSSVRNILYGGLIGIILLSIVNIFMNSSPLYWLISIVGLLVFWGLTAYDVQKLKQYFAYGQKNTGVQNNLAVMGALQLYLDFVNLFLLLLRFFGRRR